MPSLIDSFTFFFPVSGVTSHILLPPLVAMLISFFTSMGGISGAFLLLPFQMSFLGYTSPSVSGTNHVFNIVAIPSGVCRYIKEGRMAWPLAGVVVAGTLPGVFLGYYLRVALLPDPGVFKLFVGCVLFFIGVRLLQELKGKAIPKSSAAKALEEKFRARAEERKKQQSSNLAPGLPAGTVIKTLSVSLRRVEYEFWGERFYFNTLGMFLLTFVVGIIGGAYGIGGGAIIAPFCVAVFHLPVYTIAGATLMGTFITSVAGALFFTLMPPVNGVSPTPDWALGLLFGLGGFVGVYLGARCQKYVPQRLLKLLLGTGILSLAGTYIVHYLRR
ncbi:MAG: sulfite exporter TauE/SafE family protein [Alphaproteobacteria bacterium]|uniref:Probable membrane transporter protein n=1 Tax=Candidatus Nitrobium versatile TaxID=2884831 RepID=A0A953SG82_9BACT|nr:sulfite exporter TauE/SafE family protein [Candidatus Nitrobium versatile]